MSNTNVQLSFKDGLHRGGGGGVCACQSHQTCDSDPLQTTDHTVLQTVTVMSTYQSMETSPVVEVSPSPNTVQLVSMRKNYVL